MEVAKVLISIYKNESRRSLLTSFILRPSSGLPTVDTDWVEISALLLSQEPNKYEN